MVVERVKTWKDRFPGLWGRLCLVIGVLWLLFLAWISYIEGFSIGEFWRDTSLTEYRMPPHEARLAMLHERGYLLFMFTWPLLLYLLPTLFRGSVLPLGRWLLYGNRRA